MAKKVSITLDEEVLQELDLWCLKNGKMKRSNAISFMVTQWIQSQKNMNILDEMMKAVREQKEVKKK